MTATNLIRWSGLATVLGSVLWVLTGILSSFAPAERWGYDVTTVTNPTLYCLYSLLWLSGALSILVGVVGLYARIPASAGAVRTAGLALATIGASALAINALGQALLLAIYGLLFGVGFFSLGAGMVLLGIDSVRSRALGRWSIAPLSIGLWIPLSILALNVETLLGLGITGMWTAMFIGFCALWVLLGMALASEPAAPPI